MLTHLWPLQRWQVIVKVQLHSPTPSHFGQTTSRSDSITGSLQSAKVLTVYPINTELSKEISDNL